MCLRVCECAPMSMNKGGIKMNVDALGDRKLIFVTEQLTRKGNTKKTDNSVYFLTQRHSFWEARAMVYKN